MEVAELVLNFRLSVAKSGNILFYKVIDRCEGQWSCRGVPSNFFDPVSALRFTQLLKR